MYVENTEVRKKEVGELIGWALKNRKLSKPESWASQIALCMGVLGHWF